MYIYIDPRKKGWIRCICTIDCKWVIPMNVRLHFIFMYIWFFLFNILCNIVKEWLVRKEVSLWTCIFHPLSFIHSRWGKAYSCPLYSWTELKTDYTATLISPKSQGILDVRARLTNECEAPSYSLFVITTLTSTASICIQAICLFSLR